eukprot:280690-Prymnesium_polylepis.1
MSEYATPGSSGSTCSPSKSEGASTSWTAISAAGRPSSRLRGGGWMTTGTPSADPAMRGIIRCRRGCSCVHLPPG